MVSVGVDEAKVRVDRSEERFMQVLHHGLAPCWVIRNRVAGRHGALDLSVERFAVEYIDVRNGGLHGVRRVVQSLEPFGGGNVIAVGFVVHLEAMHVEVLREVEGLRVEMLPLFPAISPTRGGAGSIPREAAVGVVDLH